MSNVIDNRFVNLEDEMSYDPIQPVWFGIATTNRKYTMCASRLGCTQFAREQGNSLLVVCPFQVANGEYRIVTKSTMPTKLLKQFEGFFGLFKYDSATDSIVKVDDTL